MTRQGGAGFESFGDPMGKGGAIHIVRAIASGGQIVRVVFDQEPKNDSGAALDDGLNPSNYTFSVNGDARVPNAVGVIPPVVTYPARGVMADGEFGVDVQVDVPLVAGLVYSVFVRNVVSSARDTLGYPYSASFVGATRPQESRPQRKLVGIPDLARSPSGGLLTENGGDLALEDGLTSYKKRVFRRCLTRKGAFSWMQNYGLDYDPKAQMTISRLQALKSSLLQQIKEEPETLQVKVLAQMDARGFALVDISATTRQWGEVAVRLRTDDSRGLIAIP